MDFVLLLILISGMIIFLFPLSGEGLPWNRHKPKFVFDKLLSKRKKSR